MLNVLARLVRSPSRALEPMIKRLVRRLTSVVTTLRALLPVVLLVIVHTRLSWQKPALQHYLQAATALV